MRWLVLLLFATPAFAQAPQCDQKPVSVVKDAVTGDMLMTYRCAPNATTTVPPLSPEDAALWQRAAESLWKKK